MGGETRLQKSINLMLDDIQYIRELNNSDIFTYDLVHDCKIDQAEIGIEERHKLLELMNRKGIIKISHSDSEASAYTIDASETMFDYSIVDYGTSPMVLTGPTATPSFSKLIKKFGITDKRDYSKSHHATISYSEPLLTLEIDDYEPRVAVKLSYDTDVSNFLAKVLSQPAGKILENTTIINGWRVTENLDQFIKKRRLHCLLPFIDTNLLPRSIKLTSYTVYLTDAELKHLLEQVRANYQKNFQDIIDSL